MECGGSELGGSEMGSPLLRRKEVKGTVDVKPGTKITFRMLWVSTVYGQGTHTCTLIQLNGKELDKVADIILRSRERWGPQSPEISTCVNGGVKLRQPSRSGTRK